MKSLSVAIKMKPTEENIQLTLYFHFWILRGVKILYKICDVESVKKRRGPKVNFNSWAPTGLQWLLNYHYLAVDEYPTLYTSMDTN